MALILHDLIPQIIETEYSDDAFLLHSGINEISAKKEPQYNENAPQGGLGGAYTPYYK